ncbi:isochorismate synthase [Rosenbergiella sp. S61]|uniref:isochorismate synthase n=1 Tax=Rosenbergiella gaditana TaxID=2726987 RepID=A0ABS5SWY8_9GAMM|nr:isochorismate synthase [Rosenbergiella gaditana]MBT0724624.1 isochorismate synthase [Rosenbergiella gaditana]
MVEITAVENILHRKIQQQSALNERFLFTSPETSLLTDGCFKRITQPLLDSEGSQDAFQQTLREQFRLARAVGIKDPLVVGAIPFDSHQQTALFIPQQVIRTDRNQLATELMPYQQMPLTPIISQQPHPDKPQFMAMVNDAIAAMNRGELDKVVLSRLLKLTTQDSINSTTLMSRIMAQNPDNYHFHVPLTNNEVLLGASPELLLRKQKNQFSSRPLAGSAKRQADSDEDHRVGQCLLASTKDRHEHQLVIDAMAKVLGPVADHLQVPQSPELVTTSQLWHLATTVQGTINNAEENALALAGLLHPTPALSGYPHQLACRLIQQLEPFPRELFGGMVGWCDDKGNGEWVVTIRCAQLSQQQVTLFAGAGIVPASDPLSEWQETGTKLSTMLKAFGLH